MQKEKVTKEARNRIRPSIKKKLSGSIGEFWRSCRWPLPPPSPSPSSDAETVPMPEIGSPPDRINPEAVHQSRNRSQVGQRRLPLSRRRRIAGLWNQLVLVGLFCNFRVLMKNVHLSLRACVVFASKVWSFILYVFRKQTRAVNVCFEFRARFPHFFSAR